MLVMLKLLGIAGIWFVLPIAAGFVAAQICGGEERDIIHWYLSGIMILFALFYVIARIAIIQEVSLSVLAGIWGAVLAAVFLSAIVFLVLNGKRKNLAEQIGQYVANVDKKDILIGIVSVLFLTVVSVAFVPAGQEDSTVQSVLTMYTTDTLYQYSPMTGRTLLLSVEKEALLQMARSPLEAYYSVYVAMCRINPAKFVHLVLPFFIFPIYFLIYAIWGSYLFPGEKYKNYLFQFVIWLLYASTLFSDKAIWFGPFQNAWNGTALFFTGVLPWIVLQVIGEKKETRQLEEFLSLPMIFKYVVSALAGQLLYEKGFFVVTFAWAAVLIMTGIMRWKNGRSI